MDDSHSACLADFGSSFILPLSEPDPTVLPAVIGGNAFSVRWLAPELVIPEKFGLRARVPSKESDVYSLAMLMYEVHANHSTSVFGSIQITYSPLGFFRVTPVCWVP